jgi:tetratricopeptide (TPR) repeat protein
LQIIFFSKCEISLLKLSYFYEMGVKQIISCIFFILWSFCTTNSYAQAPTSKADARVEKIRRELNNFEIADAMKHLNELLQKYPSDPYLNELQITVRLQIMERILYARSETGIEELSFLKVDTNWENKSISSWDDSSNSTIDSSVIDDVIKGKETPSKKESSELWDDFATAYSSTNNENVIIDSSILLDDEYQRNLKLNRVDTTDEKSREQTKRDRKAARERKLQEKRLEVLQGYSGLSYEAFKNEILYIGSKTTLFVEQADSASSCIRRWVVDSAFFNIKYNDTALDFFKKAKEDEEEKDYESALINCNKALILEPKMYFAYIKMGELYAALQEDSMAILYFKTAIAIEPHKPDVYFSISEYYYAKAEYDLASENILKAIFRYPEKRFFKLLEYIYLRQAKVYESHWLAREVFPINTDANVETMMVNEKNPWYWYLAAKVDLEGYITEEGILKPNSKTREKYIEVYAWEKMLDSCKDKNQFGFARAMRKIGFLDCYVLITEFHQYVYPQFLDLYKINYKKMLAYFDILENWEKHKFDRIRPKEMAPIWKDKKSKQLDP